MRLRITFRDCQRDPHEEADENIVDKLMDAVAHEDGGYMNLVAFTRHKRSGTFGKRFTVHFAFGPEEVDARTAQLPPYIEYTVESDNAPAGAFLDGLIL